MREGGSEPRHGVKAVVLSMAGKTNKSLCFVSTLHFAGGLASLVLLLAAKASITEDLPQIDRLFLRLDASLPTAPAAPAVHPCAVATPNIVSLIAETKLLKSNLGVFTSSDEEIKKSGDVVNGLCDPKAANVSGAMGRLVLSDALAEPSETDVRQHICNNGEGNGRQDPLNRILRAYLRSATAFARLDKTGEQCDWRKWDSFSSCDSDNAEFIQYQLMTAAREPVFEGRTRQMPPVDVALYRLVALATIASYDRRDNRGRCFGNIEGMSPEVLCVAVFPSPPTSSPPLQALTSPPPPGFSLHATDQYAFDAWDDEHMLQSCGSISNASGEASAPLVDIAPNQSTARFVDVVDAEMNDAVRQCVRQHQIGLYDTTSLYGIPDFNSLPLFKTPTASTLPSVVSLFKVFYDSLYVTRVDGWFYPNRINNALDSHEREMAIFSAFRVGMDLFYYLWALSHAVFWVVFGGVPLLILSLSRLSIAFNGFAKKYGNRTRPNMAVMVQLQRPPLDMVHILVSSSNFLLVLWTVSVDPHPSPVVIRVGGTCSEANEQGDVYPNTRAYKGGMFVLVMIQACLAVIPFIYDYKVTRDELRERQREELRGRVTPEQPTPPSKGRPNGTPVDMSLKVFCIIFSLVIIGLYAAILSESIVGWMKEFRDSDTPRTLSAVGGTSLTILKSEIVRHDVDVLVAVTAGTVAASAAVTQAYNVRAEDGLLLKLAWVLCTASAVWIGRLSRGMLRSEHDWYDHTLESGQRDRLDIAAIVFEVMLTLLVALVCETKLKASRVKRFAKNTSDAYRNKRFSSFARQQYTRLPVFPMSSHSPLIPVSYSSQ